MHKLQLEGNYCNLVAKYQSKLRYARKRGQQRMWHVVQLAQRLRMLLVECYLFQVQKSNTQDSDWCVKVGVILLID